MNNNYKKECFCMNMKKLKFLDVVLFAQFILFLVLWTTDKDVKTVKQINGVIFVVLFFINIFLKFKANTKAEGRQ